MVMVTTEKKELLFSIDMEDGPTFLLGQRRLSLMEYQSILINSNIVLQLGHSFVHGFFT